MKSHISLLVYSTLLCLAICCSKALVSGPDYNESNTDTKSPSFAAQFTSVASGYYEDQQNSKGFSPLSIEEARRVFADSSLKSTHLALRVYPQDMNQLHWLESNKSLMVFYHPVRYDFQQSGIIDNLNDDTIDSEQDEEIEVEDCCILEEPQTDSRIMCPVYVLWPVSSPIPDSVVYDYLYEAYVQNTLEVDGIIPDSRFNLHVYGYLRSHDNRLNQKTPVRHVQIQYQDQFGITKTTYTDSNGRFVLHAGVITNPVIVNLINDKFAIRDSTTSNVKSYSLTISNGIVTVPMTPDNEYLLDCSSGFFLDTYKAAEYYFYENNDLLESVPVYDTLGVSIDIQAINSPGEYLGAFYYGSTPYIKIWNHYKGNYSGASSKIFGTVNHELGHATNYAYSGYSNMIATDPMIKESFASFFGWYNVLQNYSSIIGTNQNIVNTICTQGRQTWTQSSINLNYTPLFIDLYDDYNQHTASSSYNDDPISAVPLAFILSCSLGPTSYSAVSSALINGIGSYYSAADISRFTSPYTIFLP